ncbi:MAG TPA: hypothetical protein DF296_08660 [Candidatus Margulisbacteria bacterium]|nr:hypothetical protein [Candidatus Margulisiibacteriota bacterium]
MHNKYIRINDHTTVDRRHAKAVKQALLTATILFCTFVTVGLGKAETNVSNGHFSSLSASSINKPNGDIAIPIDINKCLADLIKFFEKKDNHFQDKNDKKNIFISLEELNTAKKKLSPEGAKFGEALLNNKASIYKTLSIVKNENYFGLSNNKQLSLQDLYTAANASKNRKNLSQKQLKALQNFESGVKAYKTEKEIETELIALFAKKEDTRKTLNYFAHLEKEGPLKGLLVPNQDVFPLLYREMKDSTAGRWRNKNSGYSIDDNSSKSSTRIFHQNLANALITLGYGQDPSGNANTVISDKNPHGIKLALRKFQQSRELPASGLFDFDTWRAMINALAKQIQRNKISKV